MLATVPKGCLGILWVSSTRSAHVHAHILSWLPWAMRYIAIASLVWLWGPVPFTPWAKAHLILLFFLCSAITWLTSKARFLGPLQCFILFFSLWISPSALACNHNPLQYLICALATYSMPSTHTIWLLIILPPAAICQFYPQPSWPTRNHHHPPSSPYSQH